MKQYIRTNREGEKVIDYGLLDVAGRANLLRDADQWARQIALALNDPDFTNAEKVEAIDGAVDLRLDHATRTSDGEPVEFEKDTRAMLAERMAQCLAERYGVQL